MRLPVIKHLVEGPFDEDFFDETLMVLERLIDAPTLKDEELDVIGELMSNLEGAKAVMTDIRVNKVPEKEALNAFMKRVLGSIDK
jgi:hypothetical protein